VENVLGGYAKGERTRVYNLQAVWVEVKKDITPLGIRAMHQSIH
jgi:hypothetical protein